MTSRDERTVKFCDADPVLIFRNSIQVQTQLKKFLKSKAQVQMKFKKFEKCNLFTTKMLFFSIDLVETRSGS